MWIEIICLFLLMSQNDCWMSKQHIINGCRKLLSCSDKQFLSNRWHQVIFAIVAGWKNTSTCAQGQGFVTSQELRLNETGWTKPHLFTSSGVFPHTVTHRLCITTIKRSLGERSWVSFVFLSYIFHQNLQFTEPITNDKIHWKLFNFKMNLNALQGPKNWCTGEIMESGWFRVILNKVFVFNKISYFSCWYINIVPCD